jgi:hypothetical protein
MIVFHRVLIATAILFCVGFALWSFDAYRAGGGAGSLALAIAFGVAAGALSYYLRHLRRFLRR